MIKIHKDNTVKQTRYYAVTDKGILYGGSPEILQRKIDKLKAGEPIYNNTVISIDKSNNDFDILPF